MSRGDLQSYVDAMVDLWFALRDDPSDLKIGLQKINLFLKRANFETENAYYIALHERMEKVV